MDNAAASSPFGLIHQVIHPGQKRIDTLTVPVLRDAKTGRHQSDLRKGPVPQPFQKIFRLRFRLLKGRIDQEDQEFLAAPANQEIRCANMLPNQFHQPFEHPIPCFVTEAVIDGLEVIDVEHDKGKGNAVAVAAVHLPL